MNEIDNVQKLPVIKRECELIKKMKKTKIRINIFLVNIGSWPLR